MARDLVPLVHKAIDAHVVCHGARGIDRRHAVGGAGRAPTVSAFAIILVTAGLIVPVLQIPSAMATTAALEITAATRFQVTISASDRAVTLGQRTRLSGRVTPRQHGERVRLQERAADKWRTVDKTRLNKRSRYSFRVKPTAVGPMVLRVVKPAEGGIRKGKSSPVRLTIHARDDRLSPGEVLRSGGRIRSVDRHYVLAMKRSGDVVLRTMRRILWRTGTDGHRGARMVMKRSGNLMVRSRSGDNLWQTATTGNKGSALVVPNDGNLVLYAADGAPRWSTGSFADTLVADEVLQNDQYLTSADRRYRLVMQGDGNLVLYDAGSAVWASNTAGNTSARLVMQGDGNLVLYDQSGSPRWASNTAGNGGARLVVQNDRNVVIYGADGRPLWATDTVPRNVEQVVIGSPIAGVLTSHPSTHHTPWGGDWAEDIGSYGGAASPVRTWFGDPSGSLTLSVVSVTNACSTSNGGLAVKIAASVDGQPIGTVLYAHLANVSVSAGQTIGMGQQIGTVAVGLPVNERCWTGPHVHLEPWNKSKYSCYQDLATGSGIAEGAKVGILGGEYASGPRQKCP